MTKENLNKDFLNKVEKNISKEIEGIMTSTIKKLQELKVDITDIGLTLRRENPKEWHRVKNECITKATKKWVKYAVFSFFAILAFIVSAYLAEDHLRVEGTIVVYSYMVFLYPFPFLLFFISWIKRRKKFKVEATAQKRNSV